MDNIIKDQRKFAHPFYRIMELKEKKLKRELKKWSRTELIEWLCWNDRNGVYKDLDSLREFDNILSKNEAIEIIVRQVTES